MKRKQPKLLIETELTLLMSQKEFHTQFKENMSQILLSGARPGVRSTSRPKEMVEVKHGLILRRQKLRDRIEYNVTEMKNQREEALKLSVKAGNMKPQIDEIINAIDRLMETM